MEGIYTKKKNGHFVSESKINYSQFLVGRIVGLFKKKKKKLFLLRKRSLKKAPNLLMSEIALEIEVDTSEHKRYCQICILVKNQGKKKKT